MAKVFKPTYYSKKAIDSTRAEIRMIVGDRGIGKSYDIKREGVDKGLNQGEPFVLIRRWRTDLESGGAVGYFKDIKPNTWLEWTQGVYNEIDFRAGEFTLLFRNENGVIERRSSCVGYGVALTDAPHVKSRGYLKPCMFIFEEFISETYYLPKETELFDSIISTIGRLEFIPIYMIGNGIERARSCVYFRKWGMKNVPRQKWGTIEEYSVESDYNQTIRTVAIELSAIRDPAKKLKGRESKNAGAKWYTKRIPKEPEVMKVISYCAVYKGNFTYLLTFKVYEGKNFGIFITPKTTPIQKGTRLICSDMDNVDTQYKCSIAFKGLTAREQALFTRHKNLIYFSDALTADDWSAEGVML